MSAVKAKRSGYPIHINDGVGNSDLVEFMRCTTVTGTYPKNWLGYWAAKEVAHAVAEDPQFVAELVAKDKEDAIRWLKGRPWSKRDAAAVRGTLVHDLIDCHVNGRPLPDFNDDEMAYALGFEAWLATMEPQFVETETTVFDPDLRVAGTFDALARIDGRLWLIDYKTSNYVRDEKSGQVFDEYRLQLSFYRDAPFIARGDEKGNHVSSEVMPRVDGCALVHLQPDEFEWVPVDFRGDEMAVFASLSVVARDLQRSERSKREAAKEHAA